jgi:tripartite-type tricarboxylate transporter receptor subunit TctC
VRVLAVTTKQSLSSLPGVPPIAESIPGFDLTSWNGIFGPAGMPREVVDKLNTELQAVLADKEVQAQLKQIGFEVWQSKTPEEFSRYVADQLVHWASMIRQAGIRAE